MSETKQPPRDTLVMFRPTLHDLPPLILPPGVTVRHMRACEAPVWERITGAAFPDLTMSFEERMRKDVAFTPERVLFLEHNGTPVATASAWRRETYGPDCGYLHWVGTMPRHAGNSFGYVVSLAALIRMQEEGCLSAVLHTNDSRLPAIKTYLRLGFHICMDDPTLPARWNAIQQEFKANA